MSEKTLERTPMRPAESGTAETALTPSERAERELAKIDEEMDAIMGKQSNREALVNAPGQALQPPQGRSITPSVAPKVEASGVNHLVLNCLVPGTGSLAHGNYGVGILQLGMAVAAVPTLFLGRFWLAVVLAMMSYVWSIASGIRFVTQSDPSWK
jgi:hypothetical protein